MENVEQTAKENKVFGVNYEFMWKGQAVSVSVPDINIILRSLIKNIFIKILMEPSGFVFVLFLLAFYFPVCFVGFQSSQTHRINF